MKSLLVLGLSLITATTSVMAHPNYQVKARILYNGAAYAQPTIIVKQNINAKMLLDNKLKLDVLVKPLDISHIKLASQLALPTSSAMAPSPMLNLDLGTLNLKLGQTAIYPLILANGQTYSYEVKVTEEG
ncbi:hypothetical protein [Dongshaea marina]|uniref:hypothetical protein n=1 Tax=Dongshaea marina TaxID=2047966 RepID=UPI000D3E9C87|nr:hypothetical protein [Dongshaea marina]